jgi:hypothetical protein
LPEGPGSNWRANEADADEALKLLKNKHYRLVSHAFGRQSLPIRQGWSARIADAGRQFPPGA